MGETDNRDWNNHLFWSNVLFQFRVSTIPKRQLRLYTADQHFEWQKVKKLQNFNTFVILCPLLL